MQELAKWSIYREPEPRQQKHNLMRGVAGVAVRGAPGASRARRSRRAPGPPCLSKGHGGFGVLGGWFGGIKLRAAGLGLGASSHNLGASQHPHPLEWARFCLRLRGFVGSCAGVQISDINDCRKQHNYFQNPPARSRGRRTHHMSQLSSSSRTAWRPHEGAAECLALRSDRISYSNTQTA